MASSNLQLRRRFLKLTGINILSNLTVPMAGLVDTALLGHLPDIRFLAGVALASLIFDFVYWSFGFLRMGTTGTTAQAVGRLGAGGPAAARPSGLVAGMGEVYRVLYRSLLLAALLGAALLALQWPLGEAGFALLSGEGPVEAAGRDYFYARIWGAPATLANFALLGWFLGREESGRALVMSSVANFTNVLLNVWFILGLGLAAQGAGLATMASQYAQLGVGLWLLTRAARKDRGGEESTGGAHRKGLRPALWPPPGWDRPAILDRGRLGALVRLNADILVRTLCLTGAFALFINFSSLLGTTVLAANAILIRLFYLAAYSIDGAAFATESLAGIFRGSGQNAALRRLTRLAMVTGVGFAALFLAVLFLVPGPILALLTSHEDVAQRALGAAPWLVPVLLAGAAAFVYDGLFLGLTAGRALRNSMLLSTFAVFLPASLAALWLRSNPLLWLALSLFMIARTVTLAIASRDLLAGPQSAVTGSSPS